MSTDEPVSTADHPGVRSFEERLQTARDIVAYITGRTESEQQATVPNCPEWTVYNAATHVGRVGVAWEGMVRATPEQADARDRAYEEAFSRPEGVPMATLAEWANASIDAMAEDPDRRAFFSMTGGEGTRFLWGWHAAGELGVHRVDVADALGQPSGASTAETVDALIYAARFFLPAMRRVTGVDPGVIELHLTDAEVEAHQLPSALRIDSDIETTVALAGPAEQLLMAVWGRPFSGVEVSGDVAVLDRWRELPTQAFQFGAWD